MINGIGGELNDALLQAFEEEPKARAVPQQELHSIAAPVNKYLDFTAEWITSGSRGDNAAEAIKALVHICGSRVEKKTQVRGQREHG